MSRNHKHSVSRLKSLDFDIFGMVGIRLQDASPTDVAAVRQQLGPLESELQREPDVIVRFREHIPTPVLNYLGLNFAGFTDEGFYILQSKKAPAKVRIPFDQIGEQCEILCETGLRRVPLLTAIINLTMISKGFIPLHASAFAYQNMGILVTGWSKGGKTEALLSFADHGAHYVGDEWVFLAPQGEKIYGLTEPVHVWDWQLKHLSRISPPVKLEKKLLFKTIHSLDWVNNVFSQNGSRRFYPLKVLNEAMPALKRQLHVTIPPQQMFKEGGVKHGLKIDRLFMVMSSNQSEISITPCDPDEISRRMAYSNQFELMPFFEYYNAFKFAFPERRNEFLETIHEKHARLLRTALKGKTAYKVLHPYPVPLQELFHHMASVCEPELRKAALSN